jgi:hypothetical protein
VTPVLAAVAGAQKVLALARPSRHGSVEEIAALTMGLARSAGVHERIRIVTEKNAADGARADIVTNSGHVRPIDAEMVGWMKISAVIQLMYEAWEFRAEDVDLEACNRHGIRVAGTVMRCSDNPFEPYIRRGLLQAGALVHTTDGLANAAPANACDVVLVALRPQAQPVVGAKEAALISERWPGAVVAQYWVDIDRPALTAAGGRSFVRADSMTGMQEERSSTRRLFSTPTRIVDDV